MAKMRISPELKKLIEKYRCVKDTEGMSPAKVYKLVGENENLYLKMTDSRYKGTTYDVEREKDMMLRRNLTVDEITDQILYFMQQGCSINSISFMGMGEPFANPQVFEALHDLTAPELFGLSQRRITISTIGIVPGIQKLTREYPQVNLAYSLHAPTDRLRETLMPITKTYPLGQVLDTLDQHIRQTNRKVFLAYIMLKDVNDSDRHAEQLTKLLFKHKKYLPLYHLDLIPYNQTTVTETMVPSSHTRIKAFCRIIHNAGISVNIRTQFGSDINAACGQLAGAYRDDQKQGERTMSARDVKSFGEEVEASC